MFELIRDYGLILLFFILPIIFVLEPLFFSKLDYHPNDDNYSILKRKKILLYRQIKELEMEYDIGNISDKDYMELRDNLKQEVSLVISKLKK
ncbi:MAG: hypothetical protein VX517_01590 [Candidatus Neomarinimicrobiota bacterium]|nr:hypothetical protein [Candidatus Neomarinimicrobiota bacterium]|tara:strand:- start:249 stop:524 length:276 start_codon:yes stop_codon:yes gene_type:complete